MNALIFSVMPLIWMNGEDFFYGKYFAERRYEVWPRKEHNRNMGNIFIKVSVPDQKILIRDPDPKMKNKEFQIRILKYKI